MRVRGSPALKFPSEESEKGSAMHHAVAEHQQLESQFVPQSASD